MEILTVENLIEIVDSQRCLYGNKTLFIKPIREHQIEFQLFAGSSSNNPILECFKYGDSCNGSSGLDVLYERLIELDGSEIIYCSDDSQFENGFVIGFKSSTDGFVETINSAELINPTIVLEN